MNNEDWREDWQNFMAEIHGRLEHGERNFKNAAFSFSSERLLAEIDQELLDVCAWSYFLWHRLRCLRKRIESPFEGH